MTVDEYVAELDKVLKLWGHRMEDWEVDDVRLQARVVRRQGHVKRSDIFLLSIFGAPRGGYLGPKRPTVHLKKKPVKVVQGTLF